MLLACRCAFLCGILTLGIIPSGVAEPVINEVMLHPRGIPLENPKEEWIELHNTSADMVDLSGWQLSKGVQFTIPADTTIPGKGFLILAAEVETFQAIHPEFTGIVLGDWKGRLGNGGDTIRLEDGQGTTVDQLDYATQGEWGLRVKAEEINGSSGWQWWNLADGNGKTYERVQPELAINHAQLWEVSEFSGTPGNTNGLLAEDMAPVILDVKHAPVIPKVAENVTITARIVDDHNAPLTVVVHYRADQRPWQSAELLDPDNDQVHTATIGPFPDALFPTEDAIVEYYIHASDGTHERTWPKPSRTTLPGLLVEDRREQVNNALFQVDATYEPGTWTAGSPPIYRIIMTPEERNLLQQAQDQSNGFNPVDAAFHGTFVSEDGTGIKVRHQCAIRDRGFSSRSGTPVNYHVSFTDDNRWNNRKSFQLNSRYPFSQAMGAAMFQLAGISTTEAVPVEVRVNGVNTADSGEVGYGHYVRAEPMNGDWVTRLFPNDDAGNLYRIDDHARIGSGQFIYEGENNAPYNLTYIKKTNEILDDYTDIIEMTKILNQSSAETYREDIEKVINVRQWLEYLAVNSLIENLEGGLGTGRADDFGIYRGIKDPRFVLLPHDFDTVMSIGERSFSPGNTDIFVYRRIQGMRLMFDNTETIREYYQIYLEMLDGWFQPEHINPIIDQILGGSVPDAKVSAAKNFVVSRRANVLNQIPTHYGASFQSAANGQVDGMPVASSPMANFGGQFHIGETGSIFVNGRAANLSYGETNNGPAGSWSLSEPYTLQRGVNQITVHYYSEPDGLGEVVHTDSLDIYYPGPANELSGNLTPLRDRGDLRFTAPSHFVPGTPFMVTVERLLQGKRIEAHAPEETISLEAHPTGIILEPSEITLEYGVDSALITARVPDPNGPDAISIGGGEELISSGSPWRYYDQDKVLVSIFSPDWTAEEFDDSAWPNSNGAMGFPPSQEIPTFVPPFKSTTYYRKKVELTASQYPSMTMRLRYDDAAVVWINGQKALTTPGLGEEVKRDTRSSIDRSGLPADFEDFTIPASLFVDGTNTIAIELHQSELYDGSNLFNEATNDLVLDVELIGNIAVTEIDTFELQIAGIEASQHQGFWLALFKSLILYDLNRFDRISSHGFDGLGEVAVAGTA